MQKPKPLPSPSQEELGGSRALGLRVGASDDLIDPSPDSDSASHFAAGLFGSQMRRRAKKPLGGRTFFSAPGLHRGALGCVSGFQ